MNVHSQERDKLVGALPNTLTRCWRWRSREGERGTGECKIVQDEKEKGREGKGGDVGEGGMWEKGVETGNGSGGVGTGGIAQNFW